MFYLRFICHYVGQPGITLQLAFRWHDISLVN